MSQNPLFPLCPTACQTSFQIDWQKTFGILRLDLGGGGVNSQEIAAGGNVLFSIPKNMIIVGFMYRNFPLIGVCPWFVSPVNGTSITANYDTNTANSLTMLEQFYTKMMSGAAEEITIKKLLDLALCTGNFGQIAAARSIKVSNLTAGTKTVQPLLLDFNPWLIPTP